MIDINEFVKINDEDNCLEFAQTNAEVFDHERPESTLEVELNKELNTKHPLYGFEFKALAKNVTNPNEFIFDINHQQYRYVIVHLPWQKESSVEFPQFEYIKSHKIESIIENLQIQKCHGLKECG